MRHSWEDSLSRDYFREFQNRGVIVARGAAGIGAALASALHYLGATTVILDRDGAAAEDLARKLGTGAYAVAGDLSTEAGRDEALQKAILAAGKLSYFVSTIGLDSRVGFDALSQEQLEHLLRVNFIAPVLAARTVMPAIRAAGGGAICLFTSRHGSEIFEPDMLGYGTAKAALDGGIKRLAVKAGEGNTAENIIRVFGFCPGWVQSDNQKARFSDTQFAAAAAEQLVPRAMLPEDVVPAIIFGLSRHAALMSGTTLRFDGGEGQIKSSAVTDGSKKAS